VSYLKVVASTECWLDFQLFNAGIRIGLIVAFYPLSSSWVWIALTWLMFTLDINSVIVCSRHVPPLHHDHIRHNYVRDFLRSPRLISCHKTDHILPNGVKKLFFLFLFFAMSITSVILHYTSSLNVRVGDQRKFKLFTAFVETTWVCWNILIFTNSNRSFYLQRMYIALFTCARKKLKRPWNIGLVWLDRHIG